MLLVASLRSLLFTASRYPTNFSVLATFCVSQTWSVERFPPSTSCPSLFFVLSLSVLCPLVPAGRFVSHGNAGHCCHRRELERVGLGHYICSQLRGACTHICNTYIYACMYCSNCITVTVLLHQVGRVVRGVVGNLDSLMEWKIIRVGTHTQRCRSKACRVGEVVVEQLPDLSAGPHNQQVDAAPIRQCSHCPKHYCRDIYRHHLCWGRASIY